jgi:hypothetical protein
LNKKEKEQLVIKLHQESKTIREIASAAHMSFSDIKKIIGRIDGNAGDTDLRSKSKATQAMSLFKTGKKPIDVAIELDLPESEVNDLQQEYWALNQLYELPLVYQELKYSLDSFLELFKLFKKNKMLGEKYISKILRYAGYDLPLLENKIRELRSDIIELELRKKDLKDTIKLQSAQLLDLGQAITKFQSAIDSKKQQ